MGLKISENGLELIKSFEGLRLNAYKCVSTEKYYTIGYGHYGADVTKDMVITEKEAENYLRTDVAKFEKLVEKYDYIYHFNQNQFDALVSFAYNVGNIDQLTNYGKRSLDTIREKILLYNKSGNKVLQGLLNRRKKELELFNTTCDNEVDTNKTYTEIINAVLGVLNGEYGNGDERKEKLVSSGFNATYIQSIVNLILNYR